MPTDSKKAPHIFYVLLIIACFIGVLYSKALIPSEATRTVLLGLLASLVVAIVFNAIVKESSLPFLQSEKITLGGSIGAFVITLGIFLYAQQDLSDIAKERDKLAVKNKSLSQDIDALNGKLASAKTSVSHLDEKNGIHDSYADAIPTLFSSSPSRLSLDLFLQVECRRGIQPDNFHYTGLELGNAGGNLVGTFDAFGQNIKLRESKGTLYTYIGDSFLNESKFVAEIDFDNSPILSPKLKIRLGEHNPCAPVKPLNIDVDDLKVRIQSLPVESYLDVGSNVESISDPDQRQRVTSELYRRAIDNIDEPNNPWLLLLGQLSNGWNPNKPDDLTKLYSYRDTSNKNRKREIDHAITNATGSLITCNSMNIVGISAQHDQFTCLKDFSKNYPNHVLAQDTDIRAIGVLFDIAMNSVGNKKIEKMQDIVSRYVDIKEKYKDSENTESLDSVGVFMSLAMYFAGMPIDATESLNEIDPHANPTINFELLGSGKCGLPNDKYTTSVVLQSLSGVYTSIIDLGSENDNRSDMLCAAIDSGLALQEKSGYYIKVADVEFDDLNGVKTKSRWVEKVKSLYSDVLDRYGVAATDFVHILHGPVTDEETEINPLVVAVGIPPSLGNAITDADSCELEKRFREDGIQAFVIGGISGSCV